MFAYILLIFIVTITYFFDARPFNLITNPSKHVIKIIHIICSYVRIVLKIFGQFRIPIDCVENDIK